jgi:hypothetical protein
MLGDWKLYICSLKSSIGWVERGLICGLVQGLGPCMALLVQVCVSDLELNTRWTGSRKENVVNKDNLSWRENDDAMTVRVPSTECCTQLPCTEILDGGMVKGTQYLPAYIGPQNESDIQHQTQAPNCGREGNLANRVPSACQKVVDQSWLLGRKRQPDYQRPAAGGGLVQDERRQM